MFGYVRCMEGALFRSSVEFRIQKRAKGIDECFSEAVIPTAGGLKGLCRIEFEPAELKKVSNKSRCTYIIQFDKIENLQNGFPVFPNAVSVQCNSEVSATLTMYLL